MKKILEHREVVSRRLKESEKDLEDKNQVRQEREAQSASLTMQVTSLKEQVTGLTNYLAPAKELLQAWSPAAD